jgi:hypothetical protein
VQSSERILQAVLTIVLTSSTTLMAQATPRREPQSGSQPGEAISTLSALRAMAATNQGHITALDYLYNHPLSVSSLPLRAPTPGVWQRLAGDQGAAPLQRPACPMPVARSGVASDSMPVSRRSTQNVETMPVALPLCENR